MMAELLKRKLCMYKAYIDVSLSLLNQQGERESAQSTAVLRNLRMKYICELSLVYK